MNHKATTPRVFQYNKSGLQLKGLSDTDSFQRGVLRDAQIQEGTKTRTLEEVEASGTQGCSKH